VSEKQEDLLERARLQPGETILALSKELLADDDAVEDGKTISIASADNKKCERIADFG
jgi:hypothetical protein